MPPLETPPAQLTGKQIYRITYPRAIRILFVFAAGMTVLMAFFGVMAYVDEGAEVGLYLALAFSAGAILWVVALVGSPYRVDFAGDHLRIFRWGRQERVDYASISGLTVSRRWIILRRSAGQGDVRLHKHHANVDARVVNALESLVPAARSQRAARLRRSLPFSVRNKWGFPLGMGIGGLIFLGVGGLTFTFAGQEGIWSGEWFARVGMGMIFILFGLLFLYMVLWDAVLGFTFSADAIRVRYALRTATYPTAGIRAIRETVTHHSVRGVPRERHHIDLHYADGTVREVALNAASFPSDYIDAAEQAATAELAHALRTLYLPQGNALPEPMPEPVPVPSPTPAPRPALAPTPSPSVHLATHTAPDFDFTLQIESRDGASTKRLVAHPPLAGIACFLTTPEGGSFIDPTGRFVVIHDRDLILVFDLAEQGAYHMPAPRGRRLLNVAHEVGYVTYDTVSKRGGDAVPGRVLTLVPISRRLRPGVGPAVNGNLFSARSS